VRGHIQVRVADVEDRQLTLITLEGHPLAGAVRMLSEQRGDGLRFEVQVYDRSSNSVDYLLMSTLGNLMQNANWEEVVENAVELSGGRAPDDVEHEIEALDDQQAERIDEWLEELVLRLRRAETESRGADRGEAHGQSRDRSPGRGDSTELRP
jgi:NADH dehydrogenase